VQASPYVQSSLSLQGVPVLAVTVQVEVPLHARLLHVSPVHAIEVPAQIPVAEHLSLYVQAAASSQLEPDFGVTVHAAVPLQALVLH
jgi:hypothetical protein